MILRFTLLGLLFVFALACAVQKSNDVFLGNWQEEKLEFSEAIEYQNSNDLLGYITSYKWCCGTGGDKSYPQQFTWLRDSNNLWSSFSTLKTVGLKRLISIEQYNQPLFENDHWDYDWKGLSLNQIVQELIKSFNKDYNTTEYYAKFWERRFAEGNQQTVIKILQQTDSIYNYDGIVSIDSASINQELNQLITGNVELNLADSAKLPNQALSYFDLLRSMGLHHSAYNLIFEVNGIKDIAINRDSLLTTLAYDTITKDTYWQTRNDAQWVKTYRDNGP